MAWQLVPYSGSSAEPAPGSSLARGPRPAKPLRKENRHESISSLPLFMFLCRLRDGIEQCRLALLDYGERTLDGRAHLTGIFDRPFGVPSHGLRELGEINRR